MTTTLRIADFTRYPGGRYKRISKFSGEEYRDDYLAPALEKEEMVVVVLDGTVGYGSSFLDELFGGIVRKMHWRSVSDFDAHILLQSEDRSFITETRQYVADAVSSNNTVRP
ncbi:DUF4325 domain-containing protein [Verminephrobacter aporrectodeae subsp. tuberculatae]|uniref:DUF4325 domain-containing protein n=1 Tax=Verminephrobacter aporrectodeae subsp. tuberculatae TaxID=1110392 RepID=A0ABT3KZS6_9BURK|nr:STAS-like domain-containing protein [Verminephrobacter aporrectodeae]MCW5223617.1 DUF4325 domain-containing protein [Verminephrobacter aporrectodeae subsp. tuberculatae]MCW5256221.1 DUF4325 domain-containing protein [Verminephrobacter aporrectodeae subsp. tuberculatae]MCW5289082.1 DUF4325 domain-containing protein [Verminephrobacter aporrectodeae subsp. tuberculatae]MCW5323419.1 DUF4325 domain-containing protein [Verminephrobacter aporrectodeae subsp. tuberculatae]